MRLETPAQVRREWRLRRVAYIRYRYEDDDSSCGLCGLQVVRVRPEVVKMPCRCWRVGYGLKPW